MNHNSQTIEEIFDDAVTALRAGASVENILAKYPAHKAELEEMLGVVLMLEDVKLSEVPSEQLRAAFSAHDAPLNSNARTFAFLEAMLRPTFRMPAAILAVLLIAVLAVNRAAAPAPSLQYQAGEGQEIALSQTSSGDAIAFGTDVSVGGNVEGGEDYAIKAPTEGVSATMSAPAPDTSIAMKSATPTGAPIDASAFDTTTIAATEAVLVFPQFESFVADEIALTSFEQELTQ